MVTFALTLIALVFLLPSVVIPGHKLFDKKGRLPNPIPL